MKGHQDTAELGRELTRLEKLNCETNYGAKDYLCYIRTNKIPKVTHLYGDQWQLHQDGTYIYNKLREKNIGYLP